MGSHHHELLLLGQDRMVTIYELADLVAIATGITIIEKHVNRPQGVRGRSSDDLRRVLGRREPEISLEEGFARTYPWIEGPVRRKRFSAPDGGALNSPPEVA